MKNLKEALDWRYAVKAFDATKKVPGDQLEMILEAARMAPTSFGLQPFHVTVVQDQALREKLRAVSWNQSQITDCSQLVVFQVRKKVDPALVEQYVELVAKTRGAKVEMLKDFRDMMVGAITQKSDEHNNNWAKRQAYISMGFLLLAAAESGVDSCPMEGVNGPEYDKLLNAPELETVAVVALGYRSPTDAFQNHKKVRQPKSQFFTMK